MNVNEYLEATRNEGKASGRLFLKIRDRIICGDGLELSVQASEYAYCSPRDNYGPYSAVEVGFPSEEIPEIMEWAEGAGKPTETIYGWVPVEIVDSVISAHGGIANAPS